MMPIAKNSQITDVGCWVAAVCSCGKIHTTFFRVNDEFEKRNIKCGICKKSFPIARPENDEVIEFIKRDT
jgi:hypothetical protein